MRVFIAIEMTDEIKSALSQLQSRLKYAGADVKWVEEKNIHLTLKFLGNIDDNRCKEVTTVLGEVAETVTPFDISVGEVGAFPAPEHPRVVWVGMEKGSEQSASLAHKIDDALYVIGFEKDERAFTAHLTLGRVRSPKNRIALAEKIGALNTEKRVQAVQTVSSIILFQSTLTTQGPAYTKLSEFHFK